MTEYIDRDMIIAEGWHMERTVKDMTSITIEIKKPIDFPAADVVEVIRCKDCKNCDTVDEYERWCLGWGSPARLVTPDSYCSHGRYKNDL